MSASPAPRTDAEPAPELVYEAGAPAPLPLPVPDGRDVWDVFARRRTRRAFRPLTIAPLATVLATAGRTLERDPRAAAASRGAWAHRVPPSAGGLHPIDLLVLPPSAPDTPVVDAWRDVAQGVPRSAAPWIYDGRRHAVRALTAPVARSQSDALRSLAASALGDAPGVTDATVIWLIAHRARTAARYEAPDTLIWRDAGCVLAVLSLVAEALDLACCALGATGDPMVARLFDAQPTDLHGCGGVVLGHRWS